jgi:hypothetical protein
MSRPRPRRRLLSLLAAVATAAGVAALPAAASASAWTPYDRPAQYGVATDRNVPITMRDGIVLEANVQRPDRAGRYPVVVVQTPYNKDGGINAALGGIAEYFVRRGYVVVTVDVRGTGSSEGRWESFGLDEQRDGPEVVEWAARQPWSTGRVGLFGPSYMGLNQILTAAQRPPHLEAIFPIVPMADSYRDIVFSGGQVNVSFVPMWLGLVTAGSLTPVPDARTGSPAGLSRSVTTLASRVSGVTAFQARTLLDAAGGGDLAFDGPFWRLRSPLEVVDSVDVPAFVVGGHHDLFQRGEPLLYEHLKRHVPARLLMGPWTHLGGSTGAGLPRDGVPSLSQIALRWFDRYLQGIDTHVSDIPRVTQYVYGDERYETQSDWPLPRLAPSSLHLRAGGRLSPAAPRGSETPDTFLQHPLSGICSQSTSQWTAGLTEPLPCTTDNRLNEATQPTYTTAPMTGDLRLSGPALARLWVTTTASDAVLSVRLTDVAPDGSSQELSGGWLAGSFRALDGDRSRWVRGTLLQPWHPFTRSSVMPVTAGKPMRMDVEIFPVSAVIKKGHRLRITVGPSDFPHALPPLPQLTSSLAGRVQLLHDPAHPSAVVLPTIGSRCARPAAARGRASTRPRQAAGCSTLAVPRLVRG